MVEILWEEPPVRLLKRDEHYDSIITELKNNPGRWACVNKEWKSSSIPPAFKRAGCEGTARRNKDGKTFSVYVRYPEGAAKEAALATDKAKVRQAVKSGTALTPPPRAPKGPATAVNVKPANDFGLAAFRAGRDERGIPAEGKR
ncbi:hypothetical protein [Arthrobacter sp. UYCu712]|uniref:hypothetical protein n=1 Tax=Arthrobacter sp. UYCu712 TaxID=3156340 RepID=UPI003391D8ED